jgi:peptidoglycan/LPS O-acetylase OafA/YrhL
VVPGTGKSGTDRRAGRLCLPPALAYSLSQPHLPALDALRAFAALLVVFYHITSPRIPGGLGVLAFFVLSGFLITWLLLQEYDRYGTVSLRLFYLRRSLRIFPAFYVYWAAVVGGRWVSGKRILWPQAIASFFYANDYYQAIRGDPNTALSHTWTLAIEEQFYLLWPAAFLVLARDRTKALRVTLAAVVFVWIWRFFLKLGMGVWQGYFYEAFDTRLDGLAVGCALAIALHIGAGIPVWTWLCEAAWKPLITLAFLAGSVLLENRYQSSYRDLAGLLVNPLLVAALIVQWMSLSAEHRAWRWLNQPGLVYLGTISYSIYLYQQLVPGLVARVARGMPGPALELATLSAILLAASFSYWVIERPFLRLKDRIAKR